MTKGLKTRYNMRMVVGSDRLSDYFMYKRKENLKGVTYEEENAENRS